MSCFACIGNGYRLLTDDKNFLHFIGNSPIIGPNNTRQGYARKRTLKPAGYFFPGRES